MSDAAEVIAVAGTTRRLGGERDGFQLEVPRFVVRRGECVAVTGPSGCGKSTMLDLLGLVLRPDRCSTFVFSTVGGDRIDIADHWRRNDLDGLARVRARHIGYVLQTGGLLPFLSALENIVLSRSLLGLDATSALVDHLAEALSIGHLLRKKPQALSIGERQRVSIARALAHRPAVLLADEPTAALDPRQGEQVMKLLLALVRAFQTTAIIVSHDWDMIAKFGLRRVEAAQVAGGSTAATQFSG